MAGTDFKYDVFISYSHKDEEWVVSTLLPVLENAGLSVCIDYRDFVAGKPSIVNMEDAVDESHHTVLVLTPNWTGSEWTDFEAVLTQTDDPVGRRQKMIPIMLEKCTPPKRVRSFTYVDFMRSDRLDNAWTQLFKALGKPNAPIPSSSTAPSATGSRDTWYLAHPYPMPPNFTGRAAEQQMLDDWLADNTNRLFILRALGGFGKSALAWQWINTHVNPAEWTKLVFWSFYEGDASFENFITETLKYLKLDIPQGGRPQVDELLKAMQSQKILLIMDGFERVLRLYASMNAAYQSDEEQKIEENELDCKDINAEWFLKGVCAGPDFKSKVLMTTRLTPRAVKPRGEFILGCHEEELTAMQKTDAVEFFHKQKVKGTRAEIEAACAPYGYHPLSLRLLAGRILKDFETPADIVVAQKLKIDGDLKQQHHHVLEVSYNNLPEHEQKLLGMIACFRSPVERKRLETIAENKGSLDENLRDLMERGLLHFDEKNKKFDLHPIVRRYAYERLTVLDRTTIHSRLSYYFSTLPEAEKIEKLEDISPLIERYHHTVHAGNLDEAWDLFVNELQEVLYFQLGAYNMQIELLRLLYLDGETKMPKLTNEFNRAYMMDRLGASYYASGQPKEALELIHKHNEIYEKIDRPRLAAGLGNLAVQQISIGSLRAAETNLQYSSEICKETSDRFWEATVCYVLGELLCYRGMWDDAKHELDKAFKMFQNLRTVQMQSVVMTAMSLHSLLMTRDPTQSIIEIRISITYAKRALKLAEKTARTRYHTERDFIRAYWSLGAAYHKDKQLHKAESYLNVALNRCRSINLVESEADILLDLARLRYDQKNYEEAKSLAEEALTITERCGYVLQGADVNLFLAQYALEQEKDKVKAKEYAETALKLATCDGPPYYYKVAYEEAERMLAGL